LKHWLQQWRLPPLKLKGGAVNPSKDSDNIDIEEDSTTIYPTKPRHVNFGKSKIKGGHIEVLNRFGYINNVD
jgi:hypothetical protein